MFHATQLKFGLDFCQSNLHIDRHHDYRNDQQLFLREDIVSLAMSKRGKGPLPMPPPLPQLIDQHVSLTVLM